MTCALPLEPATCCKLLSASKASQSCRYRAVTYLSYVSKSDAPACKLHIPVIAGDNNFGVGPSGTGSSGNAVVGGAGGDGGDNNGNNANGGSGNSGDFSGNGGIATGNNGNGGNGGTGIGGESSCFYRILCCICWPAAKAASSLHGIISC